MGAHSHTKLELLPFNGPNYGPNEKKNGDELFTDTCKIEEVHNCIYRVVGKFISVKSDGQFDIGANPSAEGADGDEQFDSEITQSGIDIVLNNKLQETGFGNKSDYVTYLKGYMKAITEKLAEKKSSDLDEFKTNAQNFVKEKLKCYKNLQFFLGESNNPDGMAVLCDYEEEDGEERPVFYFFRHGLEEEKV